MSKKIILITGLPGSGKTTLAEQLQKKLEESGYIAEWYNADRVRQEANDMDFSYEGRLRQAHRMKSLADQHTHGYIILDFVAPLPEFREIINPNYTVWMDTIVAGRFEDTNKLYIPPESYHFRVTEQDAIKWSNKIVQGITTNYIDLITIY